MFPTAGDALFRIVRGVEIDLTANGRFTALVRFTDGETETKTGRYSVASDRITFTLPGEKARDSGTYRIEGKTLTFHDDSFGVTVEVAKGKAKDTSGRSLF